MITWQQLERLGACEEQLAEFNTAFPDGTEVTVEIAESVANIFDWYWAAEYLLSDDGERLFRTAEVEALRVYHDAVDALRKREDLTAYSSEWGGLAESYVNTCKKACAKAWAEAYLKDRAAKD